MVVDGELDVVLLDELLQTRQVLVGGCADGDGDAGGLEVLELGTNIRIVIFVEGDVAGGGENKSGGAVGCGLGGNLIEWNHGRVNVRLN